MPDIEEFIQALKESIEESSSLLKKGDLFMPQYLKDKEFTKKFSQIMIPLGKKLNLLAEPEHRNHFHKEYEITEGPPQKVDCMLVDPGMRGNDTRKGLKPIPELEPICTDKHCLLLRQEGAQPRIFFELESMDRAQLYLFTDTEFYKRVKKAIHNDDNDNKLWYYYGTLGNHFCPPEKKPIPIPQYFVFFLVLPDRKVEGRYFTQWDWSRYYQIFHPGLKAKMCENPFVFYDQQIKAHARAFLNREEYFLSSQRGGWEAIPLEKTQAVCELIFITCAIDRLILSRGKDLFDPDKEQSFKINWGSPMKPGTSEQLSRDTAGATSVDISLLSDRIVDPPVDTQGVCCSFVERLSLTESQKTILRKILPQAVTPFVHDGEDHVSDNRTFFEIWVEMPNMREKYVSMGFSHVDNEPMYWTTPPVPPEKVQLYLANGYHDDYKKCLWKYVAVHEELWTWNEDKQKSWVIGCIEALLREDEQLRGM